MNIFFKFEFFFYEEDDDYEEDDYEDGICIHGFELFPGFEIKTGKEITKFEEWLNEKVFSNYTNIEEKYGIHEYEESSGKDLVVGFNSYEVEEENVNELMNVWRERFESVGVKCGEIKTFEKYDEY